MHSTIFATFAGSLEVAWLQVPAVRLERRGSLAKAPDRYVLVEKDSSRFRCEIFLTDPEAFPFEDVRVWHDLIIIGFGSTLYCVDTATRAVRIYPLDGYFGSMTTGDEHCLVASATRVLRIDRTGAKLWESADVAVDGVVISNVEGGTILGDGEWDPPGGWRPFALSLSTGQPA